jgi:CheY-like chemotaxis protein
MTPARVLSVGQCDFDGGRIGRYLRDRFGALTESVDSSEEAIEALRTGAFRLALVNRVLDRDGSSGLDLIRALKADPDLAAIPAILVSNYPDAQAEAVSLGAAPGFGKGEIGKPRVFEALAPILEPRDPR